jgi:hypothetical protein
MQAVKDYSLDEFESVLDKLPEHEWVWARSAYDLAQLLDELLSDTTGMELMAEYQPEQVPEWVPDACRRAEVSVCRNEDGKWGVFLHHPSEGIRFHQWFCKFLDKMPNKAGH